MDVLAIYDSLMRSQSHDECTVNDGSFTVNELKEMILNRIQENRENEGVLSRNVCLFFINLFTFFYFTRNDVSVFGLE